MVNANVIIDLDVSMANEVSERTPNLCRLSPAGSHFMEDLDTAGGIPAVMKEIDGLGLLNTDLITCTGKTIKENLESFHDQWRKDDVKERDNINNNQIGIKRKI